MHDIFLSYKREDRARVKPLVDALEAEGLSVWWDVHIEGGSAWRESIQKNLESARCVLVVWSKLSVGPDGHFVQDEASFAKSRGVYLPIFIDKVSVPLGFGQTQAMPLTDWHHKSSDEQFSNLLAAAQAMINGGARPIVATAPRARRFNWRAPAIAAAVIGVAGVALVQFLPQSCAIVGLQCGTITAPANSIAVLPFANLSGDRSQDYFSDGISEELMSKLARIDKLQVAARTSSFKFKGSNDSSATIARKLGVNYILDGSVRRDGALVRVSAQLVEASTGFERWSQSYDRDFKDIFAVQSGIAQSVADGLQIKLMGDDVAALSRGGTANPQAFDAFLRGRKLFDASAGEASFKQSLALFDAAIAADPRFAAAHAVRARTLLALANRFATAAELRPMFDAALKSARRAVELSPNLAEAQATLAVTILNASLDFGAAKQAYARAMQFGGGDADVLVRYGLFSTRLGDFTGGLAAVGRGVKLDPLNPRVHKTLGLALLAAGKPALAIPAFKRALELSPGTNNAHAGIAEAYYLQGNYAAARSQYALEPEDWERQTGEALVFNKLGDRSAAQAALKALIGDGSGSSAYQQARVYAQWGEAALAFAALDKAFAQGDTGLLLLAQDPMMAPLRVHARFKQNLSRLGLPV